MKLETIMNLVDDLGSDHIHVFGGTYEGGIHLQQVKDEISPCVFEILNNSKTKNKNFMEIGSAAGGNTHFFNKIFKFDNITIVDDNNHPKHELRKTKVLKDIKHVEIVGNSHSEEILKQVNNLNLKYDIIFIDGDHTYEGVKKDTEMYIHLLNDNGYVIYHDSVACSNEVGRHTKELTENNDFNLIKVGEYITKIHQRACGVVLYQKIK